MANERSSLTELSIRSIGVIESAELEFKPGLTVLTGETGAGKTMVLTALNLILGSKSDSDFVRKGSDRLVASGKFAISKKLSQEIEDSGGVVEDSEVIITRSVTSEGKSKITLGGTPSTLAQVNEISQSLIEIHAQSSSARLAKSNVQRELLDSFGSYGSALDKYLEIYNSYLEITKRISELRGQIKERDSQIAKLETFIKEFEKISPRSSEIVDIENEISKLGSVESINSGLNLAISALIEDENASANGIQVARKFLEGLRGKDSDLDQIIDQYGDLVFSFTEITNAISRYLSKLEADPKRFDFLQGRKSDLNLLIKRFGEGNDRDKAFEQLLVDGVSAKEKLRDLSGGDARLLELEKQALSIFTDLENAGLSIRAKRISTAKLLSQDITSELAALAMGSAQVLVEVEELDSKNFKNYSSSGIDEVKFLFTSHKGGNLLPLSKAASGGELSRVMLALEVVLAKNSPVGTYIFDEVDAGVGGKAAVEVGRRLAKLAKDSQVIVVTHLAQVAVWADQHLVVTKSESGAVTQSNVTQVRDADRTREIARLLSGQDQSTSAKEHAAELMAMVQESR